MDCLSDNEVLQIEQLIFSQVKDRRLSAELLDHFCCFVENQKQSGLSFESALQEGLKSIAPNGLHEIEDELFYLLHAEKITAMKKSLVVFGFLATFSFLLAFVFRQLHWPFGSIISFSSLALIAFFVIPIIFSMMLRSYATLSASDKFRTITGCLAGFITCTGQMFKILEYPGANILFVIGMALLTFAFLPVFFWQLYNKVSV
jgi:hypothetical protein